MLREKRKEKVQFPMAEEIGVMKTPSD